MENSSVDDGMRGSPLDDEIRNCSTDDGMTDNSADDIMRDVLVDGRTVKPLRKRKSSTETRTHTRNFVDF